MNIVKKFGFSLVMFMAAFCLQADGTNMPSAYVDGADTNVVDTAPMVTDVVAKQRYPWNGLVDITCRVSGIVGTTNKRELAVAAVMPDTGVARSARNFWVVRGGSNSPDRAVTTNGSYRLLWDAAADLGTVDYSNMVVRVLFDAHDKVQLWEGGPYWATTNIGAEEPWEYGYYFWWGDTVGYERNNDKWVASDGSSTNFEFKEVNTPTFDKTIETLLSEGWIISKDNTYVLAPKHDAARKHWGGDWRMPTYQELYDLVNKCVWTWTTMNGVYGYIVRGIGSYASNSIFLPCAGYGTGTSLAYSSTYSRYWSSVPYSDSISYAVALMLSSSYQSTRGGLNCRVGCSVRPVQGFAK